MAAEAAGDPLAGLLEGGDWGFCLDLASGRGAFQARLAGLGGARAWLALDLDAELLAADRFPAEAGESGTTRLRLRADAARPPLRPGLLDTVACSFSLHHLQRPRLVLAAGVRLLKPGGRLVLAEPLADGLAEAQTHHRDLHHLAAAFDRRQGRWHRPTFRLRDLEAMARDLGAGLAWRRLCWSPPPAGDAELGEVLGTVERLDGHLAAAGHADLRRRLANLRARIAARGYQGQTQWLAVARRTA